MLKKSPDPLPKTPLPGVVHRQLVRCGRPTCHCAQGKPHGPYFYRLWREAGKLRKAYVRPEELEDVRARCEARRQARRQIRAGWDLWRELRATVRRAEQP
jgi:hypothetical protein